MNKRKFPIANIGSVSLLMIFIVLCMVTFAALSLSTSAADYHSAETLADHTTAYYKASNKAEKKLADIDQVLKNCYQRSTDTDSYYNLVKKELGITDSSDPLTYSYQIAVSKSQNLSVELTISYPGITGTADSFYQISRWQVTASSDWNADNSIKLIQ